MAPGPETLVTGRLPATGGRSLSLRMGRGDSEPWELAGCAIF